jgi:YHS domain-containing protein
MESEKLQDLPMLCGRSIQGNPVYFPQTEREGEAVFFCTEFCRCAFEAEPERFTTAHRRQDRSKANPGGNPHE